MTVIIFSAATIGCGEVHELRSLNLLVEVVADYFFVGAADLNFIHFCRRRRRSGRGRRGAWKRKLAGRESKGVAVVVFFFLRFLEAVP